MREETYTTSRQQIIRVADRESPIVRVQYGTVTKHIKEYKFWMFTISRLAYEDYVWEEGYSDFDFKTGDKIEPLVKAGKKRPRLYKQATVVTKGEIN